MCGLVAIHAWHPAASAVDREELRRMAARMAARGPDGQGEWVAADGRVALAHRRLAVIDPGPRAAQPMAAADGSAVLAYNGEIYNFRELRAELERDGAIFRTRSDSEVLLALFARAGEAMLARLRGMYAFALWDARRAALLLARDPLGIKPLYYADDGWTLRAASQVKALRAGGRVSGDIEPAGLAGFAMFGAVPEPFTLLREVRALPAGHALWVDERGPGAPRRHFSIARAWAEGRVDGDPAAAAVEAVRDSVRAHRVSDVPVGVFLSAGVDSGALLGVMVDQAAAPPTAVTVAFDEYADGADDEAPMATRVAAHYRAPHVVRRVGEAEFRADLPRILDAMDQPSIDGFNTWFAAKAAREAGLKAVLSGVGGDELCGGYASFRDLPRWVRWLRPASGLPLVGRAARLALAPLLAATGIGSPKAAGLLELGGSWAGAWLLRRGLFMPWELTRVLPREVAVAGLRRLRWRERIAASLEPDPGSDFARVATLEMSHYLRDTLLRDADWASMAHGVELRTPLVDAALLQAAGPAFAALGPGRGKVVLAQAPRRPLPPITVSRPKTGFQTPVAAWLQRTGRAPMSRGGGSAAGRGSRALAAMLLAEAGA
jgi:asparagine synthase (glutamine-hydrolysing)